MRTQSFLFHVPGTNGLFDYKEAQRRSSLPKKNKNHIALNKIVDVKDCKTRTYVGSMPWGTAAAKFA